MTTICAVNGCNKPAVIGRMLRTPRTWAESVQPLCEKCDFKAKKFHECIGDVPTLEEITTR